MPSIQSRCAEMLVRLLRWKRASNRARERVERGQQTYTEPTRRQRRKYRVTKRDFRGHLVWTIAPQENAGKPQENAGKPQENAGKPQENAGKPQENARKPQENAGKPQENAGKPQENAGKKHIIYLHGGGFINSFASQHWNFMCRLIDALGCTVTAPNYPHAPEYYVHDVFDFLLPLYDEIVARAGSANVTVMGDSSGGGISLALAQLLRETGRKQPANLILLSPWLDPSVSNPEIPVYDKIDPFLGLEGLKYAGSIYARDVDPTHYLVSPVYGSLKDLAPISLFIGTRDILFPDCRKLCERAEAEGVKLNYREYEAMLHDWMLISLPESKQVLKEIVEIMARARTGTN